MTTATRASVQARQVKAQGGVGQKQAGAGRDPGQPGALKLARKHGDALVCVRYRVDADGLHRYTTVELIVDCVPIVKRIDRIVGVRVGYEETTLQSTVRSSGATWDKPAKLWRMRHSVALGLGLQDRIAEK